MSTRPQDVRLFGLQDRRGRNGVTRPWIVRWAIDGRQRARSFRTRAEADRYRNELYRAIQGGETFDEQSGLPVRWSAARAELSVCDWARRWVAEQCRSGSHARARRRSSPWPGSCRWWWWPALRPLPRAYAATWPRRCGPTSSSIRTRPRSAGCADGVVLLRSSIERLSLSWSNASAWVMTGSSSRPRRRAGIARLRRRASAAPSSSTCSRSTRGRPRRRVGRAARRRASGRQSTSGRCLIRPRCPPPSRRS